MQDKNKKEITFDEAKSLIESGEAPNTELFGFDINQLFVDVISDSHDSSTCENFLKKITSKTLVHIAIEKNNEPAKHRSRSADDPQFVQHACVLCAAGSACINRRWRRARQCCYRGATARLAFRAQSSGVRICRYDAGVLGRIGLSQSQRSVSH